MNEYWLILLVFSLLAILALAIIIYPLRQTSLAGKLLIVPLALLVISVGYWRWGAWTGWQNHVLEEKKQAQIKEVLKTIKGPMELVERLKERLKANPDSAQGWFLLGRLYASQNQWKDSYEALSKAHQLNPLDETMTLNYAQSLWQLHGQHFNEESRGLFREILAKNPQQPDALAMLAMDAFDNHLYSQAIGYWETLLKLAPPQSEEAGMIRQAIAKAQAQS